MRLSWDRPGEKLYFTGVDRGVFYPQSGMGVPWNGLVSVDENSESSDQSIIYIDGEQIINQVDIGDFSATIGAFTYPDEFTPYDGYSQSRYSAQVRRQFGLSYRTFLGDDTTELGSRYLLHIVYNCLVKPSMRDNDSLNDSSDISLFSWDLKTTPVAFPYDRPTSHLYIDSATVIPEVLTAIENILYGFDGGDARLPSLSELLGIFEANALFIVLNNGDGTATVTGSDGAVYADSVDPTLWTLDYISVIQLSDVTYLASSY